VKLFVAIDLESITGVVSERDTDREAPAAVAAREHMRADLDAVFEESNVGRCGEVRQCAGS
jgi:D-aminopeptidase